MINAPTKRRAKSKVSEGVVHIKATFNNTLISITNPKGDVLTRGTAGMAGFKGARKGTPFAAQLASEAAAKSAVENFDMKRVIVRVSGPGAGRESAIRAVRSAGLDILSLIDVTKLPHNGCRPRKKRRV
ncbi:MAG: 30S ribosomal protein S11 [Gammaproteobacteria bacterium]|nr:30S ribosomal protein S11 [Gammaproteobacteria bacterium]MCH9744269.1 30S ribosomal protein S11 [Gammaproteobacteria bacterium]